VTDIGPRGTCGCKAPNAHWDTRSVANDEGLLGRVRSARQELAEAMLSGRRGQGDYGRVSLPASDADALRDLLVADKARIVIEIGLAYGSSALAIAEAVIAPGTAGAHHLIIDPFQHHFDDAGWTLIAAAGLTGVCSLVREKSQLVLPRLLGEGFVADAGFVDGSHIFHKVFVDLAFLQELVRPGGLIILDDCQWPSVATAAQYFEVNAGWQIQPLEQETRLRAYRLPNPPVEARFENFQPFGLDPLP
jgi:predicted O-methyltransferase YrrM